MDIDSWAVSGTRSVSVEMVMGSTVDLKLVAIVITEIWVSTELGLTAFTK